MRNLFFILPVIVFLNACVSYSSKTSQFRKLTVSKEYEAALKALEGTNISKNKEDTVLYNMEKGMLLYLDKKYNEAPKIWEKASLRSEELYTISLSREAASMLVNDSVTDYEGSKFERLMLPMFSSLSFMAKQEEQKARVEVKKAYNVMGSLESDDWESERSSFPRDSFAHYFSAFVYESLKEWDAAIVEYRLGLEKFLKFKSHKSMQSTGDLFASALSRLAEYRKRSDMLLLAKKVKAQKEVLSQSSLNKMGEVLLVIEMGQSPIKVPKDFVIPFPRKNKSLSENLIRVSYPVYKDIDYKVKHAHISLNGKALGESSSLLDIGYVAKKELEAQRLKTFSRLALRAASKQVATNELHKVNPLLGLVSGVFSFVTEVADTRGWTLLPDLIQIKRIPMKANVSNRLNVFLGDGVPKMFDLKLKPGEKRVLRIRVFL
jgi:hypothetical protein